ncbi:hypothetical protein D9M69_688390 [compost metagenome]
MLFHQPLELHLRRQTGGELDQPVIEEREAPFDAVCHRHAVALARKNIARQKETALEILGLMQGMPAAKVLRQTACQLLRRIVAGKAGAQIG